MTAEEAAALMAMSAVSTPITVPPPDPGTPPGWPGYTPAATATTAPTLAATITDTPAHAVSTPAINFPPPSLPMADANGNMTPAWYHVLLLLFRRSGGVQVTGSTTQSTDLTLGTDRSLMGQIDALRAELALLRTELELTRRPIPQAADAFPYMRR